MPTKTVSVSTELAGLDKKTKAAHAKAREERAKMNAWNDEIEALRDRYNAHLDAHPEEVQGVNKAVRPGTEAERLRDEIKTRRAKQNPYEAAYAEARGAFREADQELQDFKRAHLRDRLADLDLKSDAGIDKIRAGHALVIEGSEDYAEWVGVAREIVMGTGGFDGQDFGCDPRPAEWAAIANAALDTEIIRPGLSQRGEAKLNG
jgi:chromosome segregation ATPase